MATLKLDLMQTLNSAISAYNAGQLVESDRLCQHLVHTDPNLFDALHLLAVVQSKLGRNELALTSYELALKVRADYPEVFNNYGLALHQLKRFEAALANYDRALRVRPDYIDALFNKSASLHGLRRFEEALASYDCVLRVQFDHAEANNNRGLILHELKRFDEALTSYDRALNVQLGLHPVRLTPA